MPCWISDFRSHLQAAMCTLDLFYCSAIQSNATSSFFTYSWFSLSRPLLSQISAYLEVKIWSLLKHENLITGNKIFWKRGEIAPKEQFLLFSTIFSIYLTSRVRVKLHIYLLNVVNRISFFLISANLICRSTDISKYFRESLGIRDNESRLYLNALLC